MDFKKTAAFLTSLAILFCPGCKEDEDETSMSFVGTPTFTLPVYVQAGELIHVTPAEVKRSSDDKVISGLGCFWNVTLVTSANDTIRVESDPSTMSYNYDFAVPDSLTAITVTCTMFASGYYNSSYSNSMQVIRLEGENKSLQGITLPESAGSFTDPRDERKYATVKGGGLEWMAENLAWKGAGVSYLEQEVIDAFFGRYYTWNEASTACPEGWRLPTNADFLALNSEFSPVAGLSPTDIFPKGAGQHMANAYFNYVKLWEYWPDVDPVNKSGLSLLPLGYCTFINGKPQFADLLSYSMIWTGDTLGAERAYYRSIYMKYDSIACEPGYKSYMAMPIRCVRSL